MSPKRTELEWMAGRIRRRRIADQVSSGNCGRKTSADDAALRREFGGERNLPFASTEELARRSEAARLELARQPIPRNPNAPAS